MSRQVEPVLVLLAVAMGVASCGRAPAVTRDQEMTARCESWIKAKLVAPSTYKAAQVTVGIPEEAKHRQRVFIVYDAANSFNAPIRETEECDFPYGAAEAKIRPVTATERAAVAETERQYPATEDEDSEPACCMPTPPMAAPRSPAPRRVAAAETPAPARAKAVHPAAAVPAADMCWQDYCPCDPPQGGSDQFLCRRLKAGLPVDDEQMSLGAGMRDARRQIDDFERDNGRF